MLGWLFQHQMSRADYDVLALCCRGPLFTSLIVSDNFSTFKAGLSYKCCPPFTGAIVGSSAKGKVSATVGCNWAADADTTLKVKASMDQTVSCSVKRNLAKGFSVLVGGSTNAKMNMTFGVSLSVE
jgi:hypothetical protein